MEGEPTPSFVLPRLAQDGGVVAGEACDVGRTFRATARLQELSSVTPQTAPELLSFLVGGLSDARKAGRLVASVRSRWKLETRRARSRLRLEHTSQKMEEMGHSPSCSVRDSLVDGDPKIRAMEDGAEGLDEMLGILNDRAEVLREGIAIAKKIVSTADRTALPGNSRPEPFANLQAHGTIAMTTPAGAARIIQVPPPQQSIDMPLPPGFAAPRL